jgi:hypothetical protein
MVLFFKEPGCVLLRAGACCFARRSLLGACALRG